MNNFFDKKILKTVFSTIIKAILISTGIFFIQIILETNYLYLFLKQNLITILVALLAINSATLSIVVTKIKDLIDKKNINKENFKNTRKQMVLSISEQFWLIIASIILLILQDSLLLRDEFFYNIIFNILIVSCFVYALMILNDTAKSIFIILDFD